MECGEDHRLGFGRWKRPSGEDRGRRLRRQTRRHSMPHSMAQSADHSITATEVFKHPLPGLLKTPLLSQYPTVSKHPNGAAMASETYTVVGHCCRMDDGTSGVTGPCSTRRDIMRCQDE